MSLTTPFPQHASWSKSKTADMFLFYYYSPLAAAAKERVMLCARRVCWAALKVSKKEEEVGGEEWDGREGKRQKRVNNLNGKLKEDGKREREKRRIEERRGWSKGE